jgi:anti-sigma28 factor (negative regulator of flagellin synthesis)
VNMRSDDGSELPQSQQTDALDEADQKRPETLQVEVESGRYVVSASELAGRIIDAHTKA